VQISGLSLHVTQGDRHPMQVLADRNKPLSQLDMHLEFQRKVEVLAGQVRHVVLSVLQVAHELSQA